MSFKPEVCASREATDPEDLADNAAKLKEANALTRLW